MRVVCCSEKEEVCGKILIVMVMGGSVNVYSSNV